MNLTEILQQHALWLRTVGREGARADLSGADLSGAILSGASLSGASLRGAMHFHDDNDDAREWLQSVLDAGV